MASDHANELFIVADYTPTNYLLSQTTRQRIIYCRRLHANELFIVADYTPTSYLLSQTTIQWRLIMPTNYVLSQTTSELFFVADCRYCHGVIFGATPFLELASLHLR